MGHPDHTDWWFRAVEETFGFLVAECGFSVAERHRHFKGNYIVYARRDVRVILECPPDWNVLFGDVLVLGAGGEWTGQDLDAVLDDDDPSRPSRYIGDSGPLDRAAIASKMTDWAAGLRVWLTAREESREA